LRRRIDDSLVGLTLVPFFVAHGNSSFRGDRLLRRILLDVTAKVVSLLIL
jgi:hypothetical protein